MFENSKTGSSIIRSEEYLTSDYLPEKPVGRDEEIQQVANAVRPLTHRKSPKNLLVYGPAGVGKTICIKHVFDHLEEETRVKPIYINCWQYNTRPSFLTELLIQLGYPAPRKGMPVDELLSKLREWLDKNRTVVVALDEVDQLDAKTQILYDLQLVNEEAENPIGVILVSNQQPSKIKLDPRSTSRLSCQILRFTQYTESQLREILEKRVEQAFRPGRVADGVVERIAEIVLEESGDCRQAIDLLFRAGRRAEREGETDLTIDQIEL